MNKNTPRQDASSFVTKPHTMKTTKPTKTDIILKKGSDTSGRRRFRRILLKWAIDYECTEHRRPLLERILRQVHNCHPPARFLVPLENNEYGIVQDEKFLLNKTMREMKVILRDNSSFLFDLKASDVVFHDSLVLFDGHFGNNVLKAFLKAAARKFVQKDIAPDLMKRVLNTWVRRQTHTRFLTASHDQIQQYKKANQVPLETMVYLRLDNASIVSLLLKGLQRQVDQLRTAWHKGVQPRPTNKPTPQLRLKYTMLISSFDLRPTDVLITSKKHFQQRSGNRFFACLLRKERKRLLCSQQQVQCITRGIIASIECMNGRILVEDSEAVVCTSNHELSGTTTVFGVLDKASKELVVQAQLVEGPRRSLEYISLEYLNPESGSLDARTRLGGSDRPLVIDGDDGDDDGDGDGDDGMKVKGCEKVRPKVSFEEIDWTE